MIFLGKHTKTPGIRVTSGLYDILTGHKLGAHLLGQNNRHLLCQFCRLHPLNALSVQKHGSGDQRKLPDDTF